MKISFCSTIKNREDQLRLTLPINLNVLSKYLDCELVICNYNSDNFESVLNEIISDYELNTNQLKIINVYSKPYFRHSHAKNIAHKNASGDVLCNLDIDNFLSKEFIEYLQDIFLKDINIVTEGNFQITYGRVALSKDNFYKLGGYWEAMDEYGYACEDTDLVARAVHFLKSKKITIPENLLLSLCHSSKMRIENLENPVFNIQHKKRMSEEAIKSGNMNPNGEVWGIIE